MAFSCPCGRVCQTQTAFDQHATDVHETWVCGFCCQFFSSEKAFNSHNKRQQHPTEFICDICNKSFDNDQYLLNHRKKWNHGYCDDCDASFGTADQHRIHIIETHGGYICLVCPERLESFGDCHRHFNEVDHVLLQTGSGEQALAALQEKFHYCQYHGRTFVDVHGYRQHMQAVFHPPLSECMCTVSPGCGKFLHSRSIVNFHEKRGFCKGRPPALPSSTAPAPVPSAPINTVSSPKTALTNAGAISSLHSQPAKQATTPTVSTTNDSLKATQPPVASSGDENLKEVFQSITLQSPYSVWNLSFEELRLAHYSNGNTFTGNACQYKENAEYDGAPEESERFQSITIQLPYDSFDLSFEELRLANYNVGKYFADGCAPLTNKLVAYNFDAGSCPVPVVEPESAREACQTSLQDLSLLSSPDLVCLELSPAATLEEPVVNLRDLQKAIKQYIDDCATLKDKYFKQGVNASTDNLAHTQPKCASLETAKTICVKLENSNASTHDTVLADGCAHGQKPQIAPSERGDSPECANPTTGKQKAHAVQNHDTTNSTWVEAGSTAVASGKPGDSAPSNAQKRVIELVCNEREYKEIELRSTGIQTSTSRTIDSETQTASITGVEASVQTVEPKGVDAGAQTETQTTSATGVKASVQTIELEHADAGVQTSTYKSVGTCTQTMITGSIDVGIDNLIDLTTEDFDEVKTPGLTPDTGTPFMSPIDEFENFIDQFSHLLVSEKSSDASTPSTPLPHQNLQHLVTRRRLPQTSRSLSLAHIKPSGWDITV